MTMRRRGGAEGEDVGAQNLSLRSRVRRGDAAGAVKYGSETGQLAGESSVDGARVKAVPVRLCQTVNVDGLAWMS